MPPPGDPARKPGMCPDQELNQQPFSPQARTQSTESHQPGRLCPLLYPWYVIITPMYNVHPYFSLKNLGKKVHIRHGKVWYVLIYIHMLISTYIYA